MELTIECLIILLLLVFFIRHIINILQTLWKLQIHFYSRKVSLKDKYGDWAVVTGSTDGIGKAYAMELAKRQINVVLISRTLEKLKKVKNEIEEINSTVEVKIIQADFSRGRDEIKRIEPLLNDIPVGILVNNVGRMTDILDYHGQIPEQTMWDMITINAGATAAMTHMIIEQMKKKRKGAIVNVSSGADSFPTPLQAVYAATKTFVRYFSDAIRLEYAEYGITVQCLSPFYINTNMASFIPEIEKHKLLYPDGEKYARNAIETLGKLDSTSGFWLHEIFTLMATSIPTWLMARIALRYNCNKQQDYFKTKQIAEERVQR